MNLVDSSGWIEFLTDGPLAGHFAKPISDSGTLLVLAVCLLEVYKVIKRRAGEEIAIRSRPRWARDGSYHSMLRLRSAPLT